MAQIKRPTKSGSPATAMCVVAAHCMLPSQPHNVNPSSASHAPCSRIIAKGRNGTRRLHLHQQKIAADA